jgi:outer membrane protein assembly factor BamB
MKQVNSQRKKTLFAIALVLMLTISAFMAMVPMANAADVPTYAFLNVAPDPVGSGQSTVVAFWLDKVPPTAGVADWGDRWQNLTVSVTKPDGTSTTLGPFTSDPVGSSWTYFTPDQIGTYYLTFSFPGQRVTGPMLTGGVIDNYYQPSTSAKVALTVQQEQIQPWPAAALPTGYWQRPINAQNREWAQISGNWLMTYYDSTGNKFNPYTTGPESAHIMWTKSLAMGGLAGGAFGGEPYYTGLSYENKFIPPFILNGRLYYNTRLGSSSWMGFTCVDLRTGQELWYQNSTATDNTGFGGGTLTLGQVLKYESPNQYGTIPYLWSLGTKFEMYDAYTGNHILTIDNVSYTFGGFGPDFGTPTFGPNGELLLYILDGVNSWLALWNSTKAIPAPGTYGTNSWQWRPLFGSVLDWKLGLQWNVTTPPHIGPAPQAIATNNAITPLLDYSSGILLAYTGSFLLGTATSWTEIGYDLNTGAQVWSQERTFPSQPTPWGIMGVSGEGVYCEFTPNTMQWYGYDIKTGNKLWGPTEPYSRAFGSYVNAPGASIAYGKLFAGDFDGMMHAYDLKTGTHLWDFSTPNMGFETAYGNTPIMSTSVADGKVYVTTGHTHLKPLYRGSELHCLDADTGKEIWKVSNFGLNSPALIADGSLVVANGYDNSIYCFGKGTTATTVSTQNFAAQLGTPVIIQGTVTDQSPGQTAIGVPAAGTPAISDASMTAWMEYLYMQQEKPADATGVKVHVTAIDPNGNFQDIGTATSDALGNFAISWTPPVPGQYTVKAAFEGSAAYYSSEAGTSFAVSKAASSQTTADESAEPVGMYILAATAIIVIAIAIVAVLIIRKKA